MSNIRCIETIFRKVFKEKQLLVFLLIGIAIVAIAGCTASVPTTNTTSVPSLTKVSVALDWFPWSAQAGLWVAKEKGYFSDESLDVTLNIPSDPSTILQTVASGRDDFGLSYQTSLILARDQDISVVSIMGIVQHALNSIISLKESVIMQPLDLVGKKIGTNAVPESEKFLETVLKSQGKSLKDVELFNVGFDLVPALISKKVDAIIPAYSVYEAVSAENKGFPVNVMHLEQHGVPDYYEFILVTTEEKITKNQDLVQRFVKAVTRGYEDAIADPEGAIMLMKKANPEADLALEIPSVKLLAPLWKSQNGVFGWQEEARWLAFAQWMKDNDLLSKDADARKAFDNSFVANTGKQE